MKKLIGIIAVVVALCFCMTVVSFAKTADIVHNSVEGTAVIDGTKDDAYANALSLDFVQKGENNGGGGTLDTAVATAYIINDAEYVYVYVDVIDESLDNTSNNNYEKDSVEAFWMSDNTKSQVRFHFDGAVDDDSGTHDEFAAVTTDKGYAVEYRFPITDVKDNQIETTIQINVCTDGKRDYTCYIAGNADADNAYQRNNRESDYDCWWTLTLAGEHADTRAEKVEEPMEITKDTYTRLRDSAFGVQLFGQDVVNWGWTGVGSLQSGLFGETLELTWSDCAMKMAFDTNNTNGFTVAPKFNLQINANGYLKLPEGAEVGTEGDSARYTFTYSDIVISAEGYADVTVPGGIIEDKRLTIRQENGYTGGDAVEVALVPAIKEQLGLDIEGLCEYLKKVTTVTTTVSFTEWEGRTVEDLNTFLAELDAEDQAKLVELQQYIDRVEAAKTVIADETADITAKQDALEDARKAANRMTKEAEKYPLCEAKAAEMVAEVETMTATVEALNTPAEPEVPAEDENKSENPADENKEEKPASKPADDSEGGNTGLIVGIIIAVVVIAIIVVVAVLGKKKKA